jgi:PAS domain S-box-containing protein
MSGELARHGRPSAERRPVDALVPTSTRGRVAHPFARDVEGRSRPWFDQSTLAIAVYAPDGRLVDLNPAFTALYGVTLDDIPVGYRVTEDPQLAAFGVADAVRRAFAGEAVAMPALRYDAAAATGGVGRSVWTRAHFYPVRDARGVVAEVVQVQEDVTAQLATEATLRAGELRYRLATEAMAGYVYDADLGAGTVERTAGFTDVVGFAPGEAEATPTWWAGRVHPDDVPELARAMAVAERDLGCTSLTCEYRVRHRAGHWVWVQDRQRFVRDETGRIVRIVGGASDVTARRAAEEAAAESERRYRELFAGSPVPMMVYDRETKRYLAVNDAAVRHYGWTREEFLALTVYDIRPPEEWPALRSTLAALDVDPGDGARPRGGFRHRRKDGSLLDVEVTTQDVTFDGRPGRLVVVQDVTERERLLRDAQAARADAERARREAEEARAAAERERATAVDASHAKSRFLATMSHELRTPLNAIAGHVQLVEMGVHGPVTPMQQEALARVQRAQQHLLALINDVLNFAKLEAGKVEYDVQPVAPAEVVADVAALVEPQIAAKGLAFEVRTLPGLAAGGAGARVWADRDKLRQVLLNLLSNAIKFTDPGGSVTVTLDGDAEMVRLCVRDTGCGIPANQLAAIFEPFVQVRSPLARGYVQVTEGTGLGLAISRDLARGMGAELAAESVPGAGSTFSVLLRRPPRA